MSNEYINFEEHQGYSCFNDIFQYPCVKTRQVENISNVAVYQIEICLSEERTSVIGKTSDLGIAERMAQELGVSLYEIEEFFYHG